MNIELGTINLINKKDEISKGNKNINKKEEFDRSLYEGSNKLNKKDSEDNKNNIINNDDEDTELSTKIEDCNYKYYSYIISNQYLNKDEILDKISDKQIHIDNNILSQNIKVNEELNDNIFEMIDPQYLTNNINTTEKETENIEIEDLEQLEGIYEIAYKSSSKEDINLEIVHDNKEIIKSSDEIDILGNISMIKTDEIFDKNISEEIQDLQNLSKTNMESRIKDETIKNIKLMKMEDIKELSVKLRPRELGDMHIKLIQDSDTLRAVITVSDKDVYNIMNKNLSEIKQHIDIFNVKEISIVVDSENNYSSDSFDKSFEGERRNEHQLNKRNKNKNNIQLTIEKNSIYKKEDGLNLLA